LVRLTAGSLPSASLGRVLDCAVLHPAVTVPSGAGRPRVLVAEDEALIRLDLVEMLTEEGYAVVGEAADGERAVALARDLRPDVVLLDIKMPGLDGLRAAQRITGERIAPVVMLTAFSQRELVEAAADAGALAYLVKPVSKEDLTPQIEVAMARHAQIAALESEVEGLTERLDARKVIERAKGRLQVDRGISEPDAFRWLQKTAMDRRCTMRAVAEGVLAAPATDRDGGSATRPDPPAAAEADPSASADPGPRR
jgi:AmiR/NasT family two-component response regulator